MSAIVLATALAYSQTPIVLDVCLREEFAPSTALVVQTSGIVYAALLFKYLIVNVPLLLVGFCQAWTIFINTKFRGTAVLWQFLDFRLAVFCTLVEVLALIISFELAVRAHYAPAFGLLILGCFLLMLCNRYPCIFSLFGRLQYIDLLPPFIAISFCYLIRIPFVVPEATNIPALICLLAGAYPSYLQATQQHVSPLWLIPHSAYFYFALSELPYYMAVLNILMSLCFLVFSNAQNAIVVRHNRPHVVPAMLPNNRFNRLFVPAPLLREDFLPPHWEYVEAKVGNTRWHLKRAFLSLLGLGGLATCYFWPIFAAFYITISAIVLAVRVLPTLDILSSIANKRSWIGFIKKDGSIRIPVGWKVLLEVVGHAILFWRLRHDPVSLGTLSLMLATRYGLTEAIASELSSLASQLTKLVAPVEPTLPDSFETNIIERVDAKGFSPAFALAAFGLFVVVLGVALGVAPKVMSNYRLPASVHDIATQIRDFESLRDHGWPLVVAAVNCVAAKVTGDDRPFIPGAHTEMIARYEAMRPRLGAFQRAHPAPYSRAEVLELSNLKTELHDLQEIAALRLAPVAFCNLLRSSWLWVSRLADQNTGVLLPQSFPERFAIILYGEPGTGKSGFVKFVVANTLGPEHAENIWTSNCQAKYDDGYVAQIACHMEEAFNCVDVPACVNQSVKYLQMNSGSAAPSDQSEAFNKGRIPWRQSLDFYSTNKSRWSVCQTFERGGIDYWAWTRRTPWQLRLSTNRVALGSNMDKSYDDLEMFNIEDSLWHKVPIAQFLSSVRKLLILAQREFEARRTVDLMVVAEDREFLTSLSGSKFDRSHLVPPPVNVSLPVPEPPVKPDPTPDPVVAAYVGSSVPPTIAVEAKVLTSFETARGLLAKHYEAGTAPMFSSMAYKSFAHPESFRWPHLARKLMDEHHYNLLLVIPPRHPNDIMRPDLTHELASIINYYTNPPSPYRTLPLTSFVIGSVYRREHHPTFEFDFETMRNIFAGTSAQPMVGEFEESLKEYCAKTGLITSHIKMEHCLAAWTDYLANVHDVHHTKSITALQVMSWRLPLLYSLIAVTGLLATAGGVYTLWRAYATAQEEVEAKGYDGEKKTPVPPPPKAGVPLVAKPRTLTFPSTKKIEEPTVAKVAAARVTDLYRPDSNAIDVGTSIQRQNIMIIKHRPTNDHQNMTFIGGRTGCCAGHMVTNEWTADDIVAVIDPSTGLAQDFVVSSLVIDSLFVNPDGSSPLGAADSSPQGPYIDFVKITFPIQMNPRRNIFSRFAPLESHSIIPYGKIYVAGWDYDGSTYRPFNQLFDVKANRSALVRRGGVNYRAAQTVCIVGRIPPGMCGAVALISNPNAVHKVCGIANSGNDEYSFITLIDPSWLEEPVAIPMIPSKSTDSVTIIEEVVSKVRLGNLLTVAAQAPKGLTTRRYGTTSLVPAPWNDWACPDHDEPFRCGFAKCPNTPSFPFPPAFVPVVVDGVRKCPVLDTFLAPINTLAPPLMIEGVSLYEFAQPMLEELALASIRPPLRHVPFKLSTEQAVNGVYRFDGECLIAPMNLQTGVGLHLAPIAPESRIGEKIVLSGKYGFTVCPRHGNIANCPSSLVGAPRCRDLTPTSSVLDELAEDDKLLALGKPPLWLVQVTQKPDEPRDPGKFARPLTQFPYHASINVRKRLTGLFSGMNVDWLDSPYIVSFNAHSRDVHVWQENRQTFGDKTDCGDLEKADIRFQWWAQECLVLPQIFAIARAHWTFTPDEWIQWKRETRALFVSMTQSHMCWGDVIFYILSKLLTGVALTTILNTLGYTGARMVAWIWVVYTEEKRIPTVAEYFATFKLAGVGDDYSNVVKHGYAGSYTMSKLAAALELIFSMKLTDPQKREILPDFVPISQDLIVRRTPVFHDGFWHLGLQERSRIRPKYYVRSLGAMELSNVANSVLLEHYNAGDHESFERDREEFRDVLRELDHTWVAPLWSELHRRWMTYGFRLTTHDLDEEHKWEIVDAKSSAPTDQAHAPAQEPAPTQTSLLTAHTELPNSYTATEQAAFADIVGKRTMVRPIEQKDIVLRQLDGGSISWTTAQAFGVSLYNVNLPYDVVSTSTAFTNMFYAVPFATFNMALSFKVNSPATLIGSVGIGFLPATDKALTLNATSAWQIVQNNGFIIPASFLNDIEIVFPYSQCKNWFDMNHMSTTESKFGIGNLRVVVWDPVLQQGVAAPTSIKIDMYYDLEDVVMSPGDPAVTVPMDDRVALGVIMRAKAGLSAHAREKINRLIAMETRQPNIEIRVDAKSASFSIVPVPAPEKKSKEKKKRNTQRVPGITDETLVPKPSKEAAAKTESVIANPTNWFSEILGGIGNTVVGIVKSVGSTIVGVAPYAATIAQGVATILPLLDMPVDERPPAPMVALAGSPIPYSRGLLQATTLNTIPKACVHNLLNERHTFTKHCQRPGPMSRFALDSNSSVGVINSWPIDPVHACNWSRLSTGPFNYTFNHTPLSWTASRHAFLSGDVEIAWMFICPPTTVFDVRIAYLAGNFATGNIANPRTAGGDYMSEVFTIRGYTIIKRRFPMIFQGGMAPSSSLLGTISSAHSIGGYVFFILESPLVGADTTFLNTCYVTMFVSGGPNMQFKGFLGSSNRRFGTVSLPEEARATTRLAQNLGRVKIEEIKEVDESELVEIKVDAKCRISECFQEEFPLIAGAQNVVSVGLCAPSMEDDFVQLLKRPQNAGSFSSFFAGSLLTHGSVTMNDFQHLFKYMRGSFVYTTLSPGSSWARANVAYSLAGAFSAAGNFQKSMDYGMHWQNLAVNPQYSVVLPYVNRDYYMNSQYFAGDTQGTQDDTRIEISQDVYTNAIMLNSVGDDFGFHIMLAPPQETFSNAAITLKNGTVLESMLSHATGGHNEPGLVQIINRPMTPLEKDLVSSIRM